jgi:hypothetical protein
LLNHRLLMSSRKLSRRILVAVGSTDDHVHGGRDDPFSLGCGMDSTSNTKPGARPDEAETIQFYFSTSRTEQALKHHTHMPSLALSLALYASIFQTSR